MKHSFLHEIKSGSPERQSSLVLYALVTLVVLAFGAFFLVGYDVPFPDDPSFNAPFLTDMVLVLMYLFVIASVGILVWSMMRAFRNGEKSTGLVNNIPSAKIAYCVFGLLFVCLAVTFAFGSTQVVVVNGDKYDNVFWLKATDMFINTAIVLAVVAVMGVVFGLSGYSRKMKLNGRR